MDLNRRNKELTNLHKVSDYLSRSLRENLRIFSVDSAGGNVSFLSEKGNVVSCNYKITNKNVNLTNFIIESSDEFVSSKKIDDKVSQGIETFLDSLKSDRFDKADVSFNDVLNLFEDRSELDNKKYKLGKHQESFGKNNIVVESSEYKKLCETKNALVSFVNENKEEVLKNKDIIDCLNISNAITKAFGTEKINYDDLREAKKFVVDISSADKSLYEMVCQQELVRQELLESKESFSNIWITNEKIQNLAGCIYSQDTSIRESMVEVIEDVPYFSFATKSDLQEILESIYEVNSTDIISKKDVKEFVKKIFDWKKPVKKELVNLLDEEYGINATNIKFVPTFSNVAKTQSVLFEVLSMFMEEGVLQDVTKDFSKAVAKKGGVEVLSSNDFISQCFAEAEVETVNENILLQYIDVPRLTRDLGALATLLGGGEALGGEEGLGSEEGFDEEFPEEELAPEEEELAPEGEAEVPPGIESGADGAAQLGGGPEDAEGPPVDEEEPAEGGFPPEEQGLGEPGAEFSEEPGGGDDSTEEIPQEPGSGEAAAPTSSGGLASLVTDLEKLVGTLGGRKSRNIPPEQYEG